MIEKPEKKSVQHVAIIMDGNYRWAKSKSMLIKSGHKSGAKNIEKIVIYSYN